MKIDSYLEEGCAGTGYLHCFCGGDFCVCQLHGGMDCPGCEECREYDERQDEDFYYDDEEPLA